MTKTNKKSASKLASKAADPVAEREGTMRRMTAFMEVDRLVRCYGVEGAIYIADVIHLMHGKAGHANEKNDEELLLQMFRLIQTEKDSKGRAIRPFTAAKAVAVTYDPVAKENITVRAFAQRLAT